MPTASGHRQWLLTAAWMGLLGCVERESYEVTQQPTAEEGHSTERVAAHACRTCWSDGQCWGPCGTVRYARLIDMGKTQPVLLSCP